MIVSAGRDKPDVGRAVKLLEKLWPGAGPLMLARPKPARTNSLGWAVVDVVPLLKLVPLPEFWGLTSSGLRVAMTPENSLATTLTKFCRPPDDVENVAELNEPQS